MPKRKVIDQKLLIKLVEDGVPQAELLEKFGFNTPISLNNAYLNALMESGKIPKIKGKGRTKKAKPVDTKVTVNGRGSLIIPKVLVESMNLKPGATFDAKKTSSGITLKAVEEKKE